MNVLFQDIRYGIRMLLKSPLVTAVAVVTLAVGIGATAAIFQFLDAALIRAVPYRDSDRLVHIAMTKQAEFGEMEASYPNFLDWQAENTSFQALAGYAGNRGLLWSGAGNPEPVPAAIVTANFFETLGVP